MQTWDTSSHENFLKYYEQESLAPKTLDRFRAIGQALLRQIQDVTNQRKLDVLDIGCGAGAQCNFWLEAGHHYSGVDVNQPLIELARERARHLNLSAHFDVATATALPFPNESIDICLLTGIIEHVVDWQACVNEAARVLRPGGLLYILTTNVLSPRQEEMNLPLYSWYPASLKRYIERRAVTDWPAVANYAKYPAVHWFSYFSLRRYLAPIGFVSLDRFDYMNLADRDSVALAMINIIRKVTFVRWLGHVLTPTTTLIGKKLPLETVHKQRSVGIEGME